MYNFAGNASNVTLKSSLQELTMAKHSSLFDVTARDEEVQVF